MAEYENMPMGAENEMGEDFEAQLAQFAQDIEQLNAQYENEIKSSVPDLKGFAHGFPNWDLKPL